MQVEEINLFINIMSQMKKEMPTKKYMAINIVKSHYMDKIYDCLNFDAVFHADSKCGHYIHSLILKYLIYYIVKLQLKSAVYNVPMLHFGQNELLVDLKSL